MFARFTYLYFKAGNQSEAKAIYDSEIAPVIRRQKGNKQVLLLEASDGSEFISYSVWEEEADVKAFEKSDEYPPVITRIQEMVSQPPVQKYYFISDNA